MKYKHASMINQYPTKQIRWLGNSWVSKKIKRSFGPEYKIVDEYIK